MVNVNRRLTVITGLLVFFVSAAGSTLAQSRAAAASDSRCDLNGTYRIDVIESDQLYSVVRNARSSIPFSEQQKFFMDMSTRLTPPDMIAIECRGQRVSVGSSRAAKITYAADGRNRRERRPGGGFVNSKITLSRGSLTFISDGNVDDNVNVAFESLENGQRMLVTRRIFATQLSEPIVIRTYYDKISAAVDWTIYDGDLVAGTSTASMPATAVSNAPSGRANRAAADVLREDLISWIAATNRRDIDEQMRFYMPRLKAYYLTRDTPERAVRLEKERIFAAARSVDIRIGEPEIIFQDNGRTAIMRFVKEYRVADRTRTRQGAVIQELRWQQTDRGWRIFSERDVRVIR